VDQRADVWSLGVLLYELLTKAYPFNGDGVVQVCATVLTTPAPPVSALRPDIDPGLDAVVGRCLEKRVDDRYASVEALAEALRPYGSRAQQATPSVLAPSEGLTLETPAETAIPTTALELTPPRPLPVYRDPLRAIATAESLAPVASLRPGRVRGREHRAETRSKRSGTSYLTAVVCSLLLGAGLSWFGWPYVYAHYGALDWRRLATARHPWDPQLNADSVQPRPLDRDFPVPHFALAKSASQPSLAPPSSSPRAAPPGLPVAPQAPTALSAEEVEQRKERYERWLVEQGLKRIESEAATVFP
jgi:serine/threonine-protein kinase